MCPMYEEISQIQAIIVIFIKINVLEGYYVVCACFPAHCVKTTNDTISIFRMRSSYNVGSLFAKKSC